jgi:SAM-dependent methyltransferase
MIIMHEQAHFDITRLPPPFNLYRFITGGDLLHFGYFPDGDEDVIGAQRKLSELLFSFIPESAGRVLDVGCGLGAGAVELSKRGKQVVGISPDTELINYAGELASRNLPAEKCVTFRASSFEEYSDRDVFDCLLFQESLQYLPDLHGAFNKAAGLISAEGLVVICDEVRYLERLDNTAVHHKNDILNSARDAGFRLKKNIKISDKVSKTYDFVIEQFTNRKQEILTRFKDIPGMEATFEEFLNGWKRGKRWFEEGKCGYEVFVFDRARKPDEFTVSSYSEGDEETILPLFNRVFSQTRSMEHWLWKFRDCPFGSFKIKLCWHGPELVAQYCGYPVDMEWNGKGIKGQHLGDSMTHPDYRGGRHGLFVRTANAFFDEFGGCGEGKTQVMYGFNTGKVQRLGRLLLKYTPVNKVTQLGKELGGSVVKYGSFEDFIYSVQSSSAVPEDADTLWMKSRRKKGLETVRNYRYMKWRYEDCPDTRYTFWTVRNRFTKSLQAIVVTRVRAGVGCLVDFLSKRNGGGLGVMLSRIYEEFLRGGIKKLELWIPEYHHLYPLFTRYGYSPEKEPNDMSVILRSFTPAIDVNTLKTKFLYTMGDSDLF